MISCTRTVISCDLIQNREYIIVRVESGFMVFVCGFTAKIVQSHDLQVCDEVLATCPDRFARVAKTYHERDYKIAAPSPLAVLWLHLSQHCGRTAAIHEKPKAFVHRARELDELCVPLSFDWEAHAENFALCSLRCNSEN